MAEPGAVVAGRAAIASGADQCRVPPVGPPAPAARGECGPGGAVETEHREAENHASQIDPGDASLILGRLLLLLVFITLPTWHIAMPSGGGVHHIGSAAGRPPRRAARECGQSVSDTATRSRPPVVERGWRMSSRQGSHMARPSSGGICPQRTHNPAALRASARRRLRFRPDRRRASGSRPPYGIPSALALA